MKNRSELTNVPGFTDLDVDTAGNPIVWKNHYRCNACDDADLNATTTDKVGWIDTWSCQCNDKCSICGAEIEPYESTWIGPESEVLKALWEALPEAGSQDTSPVANSARRPSLTLLEISALYGLMLRDDQFRDSELAGKFADLILEELNPVRRGIVKAYQNAVEPKDGIMELDTDAEVSFGDDPGAYVMVWTWVSAEDAGFMPEEDDDCV